MQKFLLDILVCPKDGGRLIYNEETNELISVSSRLAYPIKDSIPIMLVDKARSLSEEELSTFS